MSSDPQIAIQASNLGKAYQMFARPEDRLKQILLGWRKQYYREFWALRGVDLTIYKGETVGIVGRNGSGKSTLLQLICGTLTPTEGNLSVKGRVAALLELGTGFNPEFTGRENVFLNGQILGQPAEVTARHFDKIAAFADIGAYLDQPVRTYSSGMYARLAFSVAIHVDPDILIVDEALSVGDEAFQRKCFARIEEIRERGASILFVSHGAATIIELCDRAILLDKGERLLTGRPKLVVSKYQRLAYAPAHMMPEIREAVRHADGTPEEDVAETDAASNTPQEESDAPDFDPSLVAQSTVHYASRGVLISDPMLLNTNNKQVNILRPGRTYYYQYTATFDQPGTSLRFGMMIKSLQGVELAGASSHEEGEGVDFVPAGQKLTIRFEFVNLLNPGTYFMNAGVLGVTEDGHTWLHRVLDAIMFRVDPSTGRVSTGFVNLTTSASCRIEPVSEMSSVEA